MTLELYIAVLLTIIVLSILAGTVSLVVVLFQLRNTARAIEMAAVRAGDPVSYTHLFFCL